LCVLREIRGFAMQHAPTRVLVAWSVRSEEQSEGRFERRQCELVDPQRTEQRNIPVTMPRHLSIPVKLDSRSG
jgi:hypothetical protein